MSNKNLKQKELVDEFVINQSSKSKPPINKSEHRFTYENDFILLSVINRARKLKQLGFNESAEGIVKEYCNMYYPHKTDDTLKLL